MKAAQRSLRGAKAAARKVETKRHIRITRESGYTGLGRWSGVVAVTCLVTRHAIPVRHGIQLCLLNYVRHRIQIPIAQRTLGICRRLRGVSNGATEVTANKTYCKCLCWDRPMGSTCTPTSAALSHDSTQQLCAHLKSSSGHVSTHRGAILKVAPATSAVWNLAVFDLDWGRCRRTILRKPARPRRIDEVSSGGFRGGLVRSRLRERK